MLEPKDPKDPIDGTGARQTTDQTKTKEGTTKPAPEKKQ